MPTAPNKPNYYPTVDTNVTLYVDTSPGIEALTEANISSYVYFADNQGDVESNGDVANYLSHLATNSQIMWSGAVQDIIHHPNDYVMIFSVRIDNPTNPPSIRFRDPTNGSGRTHIDGYVSNNPTVDTDLPYTIEFLVGTKNEDGTKTEKVFAIDPKLRIH